jgi:hypothetical protein
MKTNAFFNTLSKLFVVALLLMGLSCESDENETAVAKWTRLISSKGWIMQDATAEPAIDLNGDHVLESDMYPIGHALCNTDNVWFFDANGNYKLEIKDPCHANETDYLGTWTFSEDYEYLTWNFTNMNNISYLVAWIGPFYSGGGEGRFHLVKLDSETLILDYDYFDRNSSTDSKMTIVFSH